ncbi:hypothetical protein [Photobacterium ganghwense]|uniref:hypothetical protein n=1 Tax=Photobacterium ganghwense TaxID=320778 RepID=UPI0039F09EFD
MKSNTVVILLVALLQIAYASAVFAQQGMTWHGSGGWGHHSAYGMMYDTKTMTEITGEVVSVDRITMMHQMNEGIVLTVKTSEGNISVHLGPVWHLEKQDMKIMPGDKVVIKGSRIIFYDEPALIASEVHKGNDVLVLRDSEGYPVWSGWRRQ